MKPVIPLAYSLTQAEIIAGAANNIAKGTPIIVTDANGQPIDIKTAQGGGQPPVEAAGIKNNFAATTAPGVGSDSTQGYAVGSRWINTTGDETYVCMDASSGAAVWEKTTAGTIAEIAGLQAALDGKSGTTHNHSGTYEPANANIQSHVAAAHAPSNAEQNVNADWNAVSGDAQILNKPTTMSPAAHIHAQSDITGLATSLADLLPKASLIITPTILHPENFTATTSAGVSGTYTVDASSEYNASYVGWKCFDNNDGTDWATLGVSSNFWVRMTFPIARIVTSVILRGRFGGAERMLTWRIEGSNNGTTWDSLLASTTPLGNTAQTFAIPNSTAYLQYRLFCVTAEPVNPGMSRIVFRGDSYAFNNPSI